MYIKKLTFKNYRNLENASFEPFDGVNVIYGDNAQGKTNMLEMIWLFTGGRSFRGSKDGELIRFGEKSALIGAEFYAAGREQTIEITINPGKRSAVQNGVAKGYMSQIIGTFCCVIFSPDHLQLIKSGPEERRSFIDGALCQIKPQYAVMLSRYRRILNERNALLKDIPRHRELIDTLDIWDEKLSFEGAKIAAERLKYMTRLSPAASGYYSGISDKREVLSLSYKSTFGAEAGMSTAEIKQLLLNSLIKRQNDDIYCGFTGSGVHRDDIAAKIDNKSARSFGSQGQQRSTVLSLKLAEAQILGEEQNEPPVILLDDVLSELDPKRQGYLINKLNNRQVFITCCEPSNQFKNIVRLSGGAIIYNK